MVAKNEIIQELGQSDDLLLPDRIAGSLTANDRAKYYFGLLQMARANADRPIVPAPDLKTERLESRIEDSWLDEVVAAARVDGQTDLVVPRGGEILERLQSAIDDMIACLPQASAQELIERFATLRPAARQDDRIPLELVEKMTSGDRSAGDSLHLLVMDAHKAINALQADTAIETLMGARVHTLSPRISQFAARGAPMILFRDFAETADYQALRQVAGLVTAQGARTSHAAVVARQLGKVCIVGCRDLQIEASGRGGRIGAHVLQEGDLLSIDGGDASIYEGELPVRSEKPESLLAMVDSWREAARRAAPCSD